MSSSPHNKSQVENQETFYRSIFDDLADATFVIDAYSRKIINANKAAELHLGYSCSDLVGMSMEQFTPLIRRSAMQRDFSRLQKGKAFAIDGTNLTKTGRKIPVQIGAVLTRIDGREVMLVSCRDISQQREIEFERLRLEKLDAVRKVAGGIAHELSQPLQGLMAIADLVENPDLGDGQMRKYVSKLPDLVDRINILLRQMKNIVRLATRPYSDESDIVDIYQSSQVSRMLILDAAGKFGESTVQIAKARGINAKNVVDVESTINALESEEFDLLLCMSLPSESESSNILNDIRQRWPKLQVVIMPNDD